MPLNARGIWHACRVRQHSTVATISNNIGSISPNNTVDPLGTIGSDKYDTSIEWNTFYDTAEVMKATVTFRVMNGSIIVPFYFWAIVSESATSPIATDDLFADLCEAHRIKYILIKPSSTVHTNATFKTLKYTVYSKEYLKSRGTKNWPNDNSHLLNATPPSFIYHIHFGITSFTGVAFTASQLFSASIDIHSFVTLKQRALTT